MLFEVHDTVVPNDDHTLIGSVVRTHAISTEDSSLEERLIFNYTNVPEGPIINFWSSGTPPRGYVFVVCLSDEKGSYLAHESDLRLVSRSYGLGEEVKRAGQTSSMIGTVIAKTDVYTLMPIFHKGKDGKLWSNLSPVREEVDRQRIRGEDCECEFRQHELIDNVHAQELAHAQLLFDGDLAVRDGWVGTMHTSDVDVVLLRPDEAIVVLKSDAELFTPILESHTTPLVQMPESEGLTRPPVVGAINGWNAIPLKRSPNYGSVVVTSAKSLSHGRWIRGEFSMPLPSSGVPAVEGVVIGIVPRSVDVKWSMPTPFSRNSSRDFEEPGYRQTIYQNINTFTSWTDLKKKEEFSLCHDRGFLVDPIANGLSTPVGVLGDSDLHIGDQVRFRYPAEAELRHCGRGKCHAGAYNPIKTWKNDMCWDVNYLTIVGQQQHVTVQWQNGVQSIHPTNELCTSRSFEVPLVPGSIVLEKAGIKMKPDATRVEGLKPETPAVEVDFNEMATFEQPHMLTASRVGIIQAIEPEERVAQVRWFQSPKVKLHDNGATLSFDSVFGPIGEAIYEVSVYEIMTVPALDWRIGELVMLPPSTTLERLGKMLRRKRMQFHNLLMEFDQLKQRAKFILKDSQTLELVQNIICNQDGTGDGAWIGEILLIRLDGQLDVKMMDGKVPRLATVPLDLVISKIHVDDGSDFDYNDEYGEFGDEEMDVLGRLSPTVRSEHEEYEGGERLDDDLDDDVWSTETDPEDDEGEDDDDDDDDDDDIHDPHPVVDQDQHRRALEALGSQSINGATHYSNSDVEMADVGLPTSASQFKGSTDAPLADSICQDQSQTEPPFSFDVLDIEPPQDQFSRGLEPNTSPFFLKRIAQEHKALSTSLPEGQIYVRTYGSRLDLLRCLIIGPPDTPYEDAPFVVDLHLGRTFPDEPPVAFFHSWTSGLGRINPNLYEDGKICLSLLGTWPGNSAKEGWSKDATILQVLISLQGLVMTRNPYFNEAGYEGYEAEGLYKPEAALYAEKAYVMARGFVKHALERPPVGLADVLAWLYMSTLVSSNGRQQNTCGGSTHESLLNRILDRGQALIKSSEQARSLDDGYEGLMDAAGNIGDPTKAFLRPLSRGAIVMLTRLLGELQETVHLINRDDGGPA